MRQGLLVVQHIAVSWMYAKQSGLVETKDVVVGRIQIKGMFGEDVKIVMDNCNTLAIVRGIKSPAFPENWPLFKNRWETSARSSVRNPW